MRGKGTKALQKTKLGYSNILKETSWGINSAHNYLAQETSYSTYKKDHTMDTCTQVRHCKTHKKVTHALKILKIKQK